MKTLLFSDTDVYGYPVNHFNILLPESQKEVKVSVKQDEYGWTATGENYNGEGDNLNIAFSRFSEDDAISEFVEKVDEWYLMNKD